MITETKHVLGVVALIMATGIATVEATRSPAQADSLLVSGADYPAMRIGEAFAASAMLPPATVAAAEKGDMLPIGCAGPLDPTFAAECLDSAYEVASDEGDVVVETRFGSTSVLTRMERFTVAGY